MQKPKTKSNRWAWVLIILIIIGMLLLISGLIISQKTSDIRATMDWCLLNQC